MAGSFSFSTSDGGSNNFGSDYGNPSTPSLPPIFFVAPLVVATAAATVAYSYLNETLGLENFEAFLHEEATANRFDNLVGYNGDDPRGIARSLAVFSAFAEGVSLYSAFAVLYSFQLL